MRRTPAIAAGAAVIALYAIGSLLSARLGVGPSPMLDGLSPPPPYRWVNPPADLAAGNEEPAGGSFELSLTKKGSTAGAFSTPDSQATVIVSEGSIPAAEGEERARIELTPVDPGRLGDPPPDLELAGNAYQITATYEPGEEPVPDVVAGGDQRVIMVYPAAAEGEHQAVTILSSPDGKEWTKLETSDASVQQQAQATFDEFGYFVVGRPPTSSGLSTSAIGVVVLSAILLLLGGLVIARNVRRGRSSPGRS